MLPAASKPAAAPASDRPSRSGPVERALSSSGAIENRHPTAVNMKKIVEIALPEYPAPRSKPLRLCLLAIFQPKVYV
jgi:hypothetical protein